MNTIEKMENEYMKALKTNPCNASLNNDYAVFLYKYKHDYAAALMYLNRAVKFNPANSVYISNINKILRTQKTNTRRRYYIFSFVVAAVMLWIGYNGYTNFMNIFSLFVLIQIVLNYQNNLYKIYS